MTSTTDGGNRVRRLPTVTAMASAMNDEIANNSHKSKVYGPVATYHLRKQDISDNARRLREELKRGRESVDLANIDAVTQRVQDYLEACEQAARFPLWCGLCPRGFGLSVSYVNKWRAQHPNTETAEFLQRVSDSFADIMEGAALDGSAAPVSAIFGLKNMHAWQDKYEVEPVAPEPERDHLTAEEIARKYLTDGSGAEV